MWSKAVYGKFSKSDSNNFLTKTVSNRDPINIWGKANRRDALLGKVKSYVSLGK